MLSFLKKLFSFDPICIILFFDMNFTSIRGIFKKFPNVISLYFILVDFVQVNVL